MVTLLEACLAYQGRDRGRYVDFDCPTCGKPRRAYAYHKTRGGGPNVLGFWRCNRSSCGASGYLLNRPQVLPGTAKTPVKTEELRDLTPAVRPGLGRLSPRAQRYLKTRLPGADLRALGPFIVNPAKTRGDIKKLGQQGWELCALLHAIDEPIRVASLQGRFVLGDERLEHLWGRSRGPAPKVRSLKGAYGDSGATFGRLDKALEAAQETGFLVVVEGLIDFLTARASGLRAVVGVPGVAFAQKLARHLKEQAWSGRLVLSLDGDEAGAASLLKVFEELEDEASIQVANGRPLDDQDLNDVYRTGGAAAVQALVRDARIAPRPLRLPPGKRSRKAKTRSRKVYGNHHDKRYSALRALGWTGCCGVVTQERRRFQGKSGGSRLLSKRPRLCEGKSCPYCRSKIWPLLVASFRSSWPKVSNLAMVKLEDNRPQEVGQQRRRISQKTSKLRKELGGSYLTAGDVLRGRFIVLVDDENPRLLEILEAELGASFKRASVDEALDELKWAYIGLANHAAELLETEENLAVIESDPWLVKRSRWASTVGRVFRLPSSKELEIESDADKDRPGREPEGVEFDLYLSKVEERIAAVTIEPLPCKALMDVIEGRPLGILSPGLFNLLEYPDELGSEGRRFLEELVGAKLEARGRAPDDGCVPAAQRASYYARRDALHRIERILRGISPPQTGPP